MQMGKQLCFFQPQSESNARAFCFNVNFGLVRRQAAGKTSFTSPHEN